MLGGRVAVVPVLVVVLAACSAESVPEDAGPPGSPSGDGFRVGTVAPLTPTASPSAVQVAGDLPELAHLPPGRDVPVVSRASTQATTIRFANTSARAVDVRWITFTGSRTTYQTLDPGEGYQQPTYVGHAWVLTTVDGTVLFAVVATEQAARVTVS